MSKTMMGILALALMFAASSVADAKPRTARAKRTLSIKQQLAKKLNAKKMYQPKGSRFTVKNLRIRTRLHKTASGVQERRVHFSGTANTSGSLFQVKGTAVSKTANATNKTKVNKVKISTRNIYDPNWGR